MNSSRKLFMLLIRSPLKERRVKGLPSEMSSCEVNTLKINNKVEQDFNSVLKGFRNYYLPSVENLVKILPKSPNEWKFNQ